MRMATAADGSGSLLTGLTQATRLERDLARRLARNVDETFVDAQPVEDGGFVAYEWIGEQNYLGEPRPRVRGANITSLDALMCAIVVTTHQR